MDPPRTATKVTVEPAVHGTASIFDLQPQDKTKIGNLIRKVVELDTECKTTEQKAKANQRKLEKQLTALKSQNTQIIRQHTKLRSKFQQSLKLLQNYQMKLNQMDTLQSSAVPKERDRDEYAAEIQKEISDLKQLILDLHRKEELKQKQREKEIADSRNRERPKEREMASRESMVCHSDRCCSFLDGNDDGESIDRQDRCDEIQSLSPIRLRTPKSHQRPPAPHPHPVHSKVATMTLSQLRKYSVPSSSSASPPPSTVVEPEEGSPCKPPLGMKRRRTVDGRAVPNKKLDTERISHLLRIQSGNFEKERSPPKEETLRSRPKPHPLSSSVDNLNVVHREPALRRVQSAAVMELNARNTRQNERELIYSDDECDRLSHYEGLDLGISFPDTLSDSDQDDELLLIQHLNVLPQ